MEKLLRVCLFNVLVIFTLTVSAQQPDQTKEKKYPEKKWKDLAINMPDAWYASEEAKSAADSVLKYQTKIGGWAKNQNYHLGFNQIEWAKINSSGIGATFDNGATLLEMKFLAKMYHKVKDGRYKKAIIKGFDYILEAQYDNGGWPQFYPLRKGNGVAYNSHITYNDNAMVNIMRFLKDIIDGDELYTTFKIPSERIKKANIAFENGLDCILKTQIKVKNKPTVWCAQHDEFTLSPAKARAYELASFSGAESVNIVFLLMDIKNPTNEIADAVKGAVNWYKTHKIEGIKLKSIINTDGLKDVIVVKDENAPALWARFYDLETELPIFCDRDGVKRDNFAALGYNRRNGYSWYTSGPSKLIDKFPDWAKKWGVH